MLTYIRTYPKPQTLKPKDLLAYFLAHSLACIACLSRLLAYPSRSLGVTSSLRLDVLEGLGFWV